MRVVVSFVSNSFRTSLKNSSSELIDIYIYLYLDVFVY